MLLRNILDICRIKRAKKQFKKHAIVSSNMVFLPGASCRNSGNYANVLIKDHCTIGASFIALFGGKITVDENTYIGGGTVLQSKERITIGKNVIVANNVLLVDNNNHPTAPEERMKMSQCNDFLNDDLWSWKYAESKPIIIEDNVWIGRDSRILKGVKIGKGSIVALGAIVTHDVPPYSVVAGNPAKVVKKLKSPEDI